MARSDCSSPKEGTHLLIDDLLKVPELVNLNKGALRESKKERITSPDDRTGMTQKIEELFNS